MCSAACGVPPDVPGDCTAAKRVPMAQSGPMEPSNDAPPSRGRALAALHIAVALFGFAGLFGKWLALPAVMIVFGRTLVASVALAVMLRLDRVPAAIPGRGIDGRLAI